METEADEIGAMLMALAAYDPYEAPKLYKKLGEIKRHPILDDYLSSHPYGQKRAEILANSPIMIEAYAVYRELKRRS